MAIKYVCMSDLHLGSSRSLLTEAADAGGRPSAVLPALIHCLRSLLADNEGVKPVLVLNGDVLEFALASDEVSAAAFQHLMELVMCPGEEIFSEVWHLPGNHDHHLWEAARESQFADYLARHPADPIPHPWFGTPLLREQQPHPVASPLLTTLLARARLRPGTAATETDGASEPAFVSANYPNLAVVAAERCVVFHHGHYIEWPYQLLTILNTKLFGAPEPPNVSALEEGNFAWIDFFWSALGRTGEPGENVQYVYDHLTSETGRRELVKRISHNLSLALENKTSLGRLEDDLQERAISIVLGLLADWGDSFGRAAYYGNTTAVKAHDAGLADYLDRYVAEQIRRECVACDSKQVTFVFGHTHHPLVRRAQQYPSFARPVDVFNTGGWVHEIAGLQPQVGASLVLIDDELNAVALELYREIAGLEKRYPRVQVASDSALPLRAAVERRVEQERQLWAQLCSAIAGRIAGDITASDGRRETTS